MARDFKQSEKCYCAFCKHERRVYTKKHISLINVFYALLFSGILMYLFWGDINPKAIVVFAILLSISEYFVQLRWRLNLRCKVCGFDPVLYLKEPKKALKQVKTVIKNSKENKDYLGTNPLSKLKAIRKKASEKLRDEVVKSKDSEKSSMPEDFEQESSIPLHSDPTDSISLESVPTDEPYLLQ